MDPEKKNFGKWWALGVALVVFAVVVFTLLGYAGIIGQTAVERVVFEQSFQYSEAAKAKIATYRAQLVELDAQLAGSGLSVVAKDRIRAQRAAVKVRLASAEELAR